MNIRALVLLGLAGLLLLPGRAAADFLAPSLAGGFAWDRPTGPGSAATFQAWDFFLSPDDPLLNPPQTVYGSPTGSPFVATTTPYSGFGGVDPDGSGPNPGATWATVNGAGVATVYDANSAASGSFITGGGFGNIYSPGGLVQPRITIPNNIDGVAGNNPAGTTVIVLQVRTGGSLLDPASVLLTDPVSGTQVSPFQSEVFLSQPLGGFGGTREDRLFVWYVNGNADQYRIDFSAATSSMSLDRVSVDTYWSPTVLTPTPVPVPEPQYVGLMAVLGSAGVWLARGFCRTSAV